METDKQCVKYIQYKKTELQRHQNDVIDDIMLPLLLTWLDFTHCFGVSIVELEQANAGWEYCLKPIVNIYNESLCIC